MTKITNNIDNLGYERRPKDSYYTPEWCTEVLLQNVSFRNLIWEPACGEGHITKVLEKHFETIGYSIQATDIKMGDDFLKIEDDWQGDIITNPPYNLAHAFVVHSINVTKKHGGKVAMLLRNEWDSAKTRNCLFTEAPFYGKVVLTKRPVWIEGPLKASPRHNYSWFIWDWSKAWNAPPILMYQKA